MLVAGVGAKSLPLARGGGVRGIMIPCQLPINFSVDNLEYIYNIASYVNSLNEKGELPRTFLHNPRQLNVTCYLWPTRIFYC